MKDFNHFGIKRRIFPKNNYDAIWVNLKTTRFDHSPGKEVQPATELPANKSEFYDVSLGTVCTTGKCPFCFPAGTGIVTDNGIVNIEDIKAGTNVLSYNDLFDGTEFAIVEQLFERHYEGKMYKFRMGSARIICTENHPIYVVKNGDVRKQGQYMSAKEIADCINNEKYSFVITQIPYACVSDNYYGKRDLHAYANEMVTGTGTTACCEIDSVETFDYNGLVYNIGVQHNHNYFADGVLVHNCYVASNPHGHFYENVCDTWRKWMSTFKEKVTKTVNGVNLTLSDKPFQIAIGSEGEPTEHPDFCEFLKTVYETNVVPNYTTNGVILSEDNERSEKILEYTSKYVGGVAVSFGNEHLRENAKKAVQKLIDKGNCHINLHHIISDMKSVDEFVEIWKQYGDNIKYHVLLPLMPSGRSTKGIEDGVFEYLESKIMENDMKNVSFGAHFVKFLEKSAIKTWLYPPESFSKNVLLKKDHVVITPSSFNMKPVYELKFNNDGSVETLNHREACAG